MKNYFEYPINEQVKKKLFTYYENTDLNQHGQNHTAKSNLKICRIKEHIFFSKNDLILDVGCSRGYILRSLAKTIKQGKGIDISKNIIRLNKKLNLTKNLSFEAFNGSKIPFKTKFTKILLLDILEHAFYPDTLLASVRNNMTKNSLLIIEVPFTGWLSELFAGKYHQGHLRYYDPDYLSIYLKRKGFTIKKIKVYNSVPYSSFFLEYKKIYAVLDFLIRLIPSKIYPYFGEILIVVSKNEK